MAPAENFGIFRAQTVRLEAVNLSISVEQNVKLSKCGVTEFNMII